MIRVIRSLILSVSAILIAFPAFAETRDINQYLLDLFDNVVVEGNWDMGTPQNFGAADTTPDVQGGSLWLTNGSQTITNFDGTTYSVGKIVYVLTTTGTTTWDCATSFYCGDTGQKNFTTVAGEVTVWIFDGTYWRLAGGRFQSVVKSATVTVDLPINGRTQALVRAPGSGNSVLSAFGCTAVGGSLTALTVALSDCAADLSTCGATGGSVALSALNAQVADTTFTDATNVGGRYWRVDFSGLTGAPDLVTCSIDFTAQ